jgi:TolA-binding protein
MKFATVSKSLILGLAVLLASSAFAATKVHFQLSTQTIVNGTTLKPGEYNLQWEGSGPNVEVSIMQGKKVLAKTNAKIVDLSSPSQNDAAVVKDNGDGTTSLAGARFSGKRFALDLSESSESMQPGSSR